MKRSTVIVGLVILLTFAFFIFYSEGKLPVNDHDTTKKTFVVEKGSSVNTIINKLESEGLIRNKIAFFILVKKMDIENKIQAGSFRLAPSMSAVEVADALTKGSNDIWVTVIEGLRKEEVAAIMADNFKISEEEFIQKSQEGKLFPDTYLIPRDATTDMIISIMENNFNTRYSAELRAKVQARGLTDAQAVTLASLVEREANTYKYMAEVASILLKRYRSDWPLQIDATVQYALGYQDKEGTWWKKYLTKDDLAINSLYNTYKKTGIPPAPIASPGLNALTAVANANAQTPYWYYISNADGSSMLFSKTLEEHNANIDKHLR